MNMLKSPNYTKNKNDFINAEDNVNSENIEKYLIFKKSFEVYDSINYSEINENIQINQKKI